MLYFKRFLPKWAIFFLKTSGHTGGKESRSDRSSAAPTKPSNINSLIYEKKEKFGSVELNGK
jgi:hypothetical protein